MNIYDKVYTIKFNDREEIRRVVTGLNNLNYFIRASNDMSKDELLGAILGSIDDYSEMLKAVYIELDGENTWED